MSSAINASFKNSKIVPHQLLQERLAQVKALAETKLEAYEIHKDTVTGEHYLIYYYERVLVAENNHVESYYHLMPLETDEVLAIVQGEADYHYPDFWIHPYLRNSSVNESYVWFDPGNQAVFAHNEEVAVKLKAKFNEFKNKGVVDEATIQKLFDELDGIS